MNTRSYPNRGGLPLNLAPFLLGGLLTAAVVDGAVPALAQAGWEALVAWMVLAVPVVFIPVIAVGIWLLKREEKPASWRQRLWLTRPTGRDWLWFAVAAVAMLAWSWGMFRLVAALGLPPNPPFSRHVLPLTPARWWLVAVWAVYFPFNILGEEFIWRMVLLPRMEAQLGL